MPSISLTLYISKLSTFPMLAEAGLLLYAVCIVQAQIAEMEVQFKRQHADGSLDIAVTCSSTKKSILTNYYFRRVGPCDFRSTSRPDKALASLGSWGPVLKQAPNYIERCEHQLRLVDTQMDRVMANQVVSGEGGGSRNTVLPTVSSEEQLFCQRHFEYCTDWTTWKKDCTNIERKWASSFVRLSSNIRKMYVRAAEINIESSITALDIPYNGNVTLECEVQNMKELPEDRCRWQFMNDQNTLHSYGGGQDTDVDAAASFPRNMAVVRRDTQRPNVCLLELAGVDETMEGHWSCNPSEGSADGFISPSTPVLIKVVDGCKSHGDCPKNQSCLNATDEVPHRICGNSCDLEKGKKICGNLENALCKVDKKAAVGMVCACQDGYGSDTGYPDNRTRCLPLCPNKNQDCIAVEGVCIPVRQNTPAGRCFPVCEVTMPQCGPGASCQKMPPINTNAPWTSKCECEGGKFKNDLLPNTSFECELPIFNGLHMNIKIDGEQRQTCSIPHANSGAKCQNIVTDGSLLQVTCEAPRVFPADATLELGLTMNSGDNDSLLRGPSPDQPSPKITAENLHDQIGTLYRGQLPAIHVNIPGHDNATFVCKLTSPASGSTIIEMRLTVAPSANGGGSWLVLVIGSTAAIAIVIVTASVAIVVMAKKRRQQHREQQKASKVHVATMRGDSVSHSRRVNSDSAEDEEFDGREYEEIIPQQLRPIVEIHESAATAANHAHQRLVHPSPIPPDNHSQHLSEQENFYF